MIYAETLAKRDYLLLQIYKSLKDHSVEVYDYPDNEESVVGRVFIDKVMGQPTRVPSELAERLHYRALIKSQTIFQEE